MAAKKRGPAIEGKAKLGGDWGDDLTKLVAKALGGAMGKAKKTQARRIVTKTYAKAGYKGGVGPLYGGPQGPKTAEILGNKIEGQLAKTRVARYRKYGKRK